MPLLGWIIAAALLALMALLYWLYRRGALGGPSAPFTIEHDETSIIVTDNFGHRHAIRWDDLEKVAIRTADDGPSGADVFWGLQTRSSDNVLVFPEGAAGERELVDAMARRLPGFDDDQVMQAMGTTANGLFVVWEKESQPVLPGADPHEE